MAVTTAMVITMAAASAYSTWRQEKATSKASKAQEKGTDEALEYEKEKEALREKEYQEERERLWKQQDEDRQLAQEQLARDLEDRQRKLGYTEEDRKFLLEDRARADADRALRVEDRERDYADRQRRIANAKPYVDLGGASVGTLRDLMSAGSNAPSLKVRPSGPALLGPPSPMVPATYGIPDETIAALARRTSASPAM